MVSRTYTVTYRNGKTQTVNGNIVLFSSVNTELSRPSNAVYLNADEVISIIEQTTSEK